MAQPIATPPKHSAYRLVIRDDEALFLDVLCFQGKEHLSQTFKYSIEFTCEEQDLPIERLLNRDASFLIFPAPHTLPKANKWDLPKPAVMPLRTLYGVVTGLKRLSDSPDEARYELTLEPRLALAGRGQQYRIYQQKSVPEIVDGILRSRHGFRGQDFERAKIAYQVNARSLDPELSTLTELTLSGTVTHHQKSVMVDYELPDSAIGFVMGHNMLDEYWDTDLHSSLKRSPESKPAPNQGSRGVEPRQDISSQISGPILEHLHHNFATAWHKETGENLLKLRKAKEVGPTLKCTQGSKRQIAQLLRTQAQTGRRDIEHLYLQAVNNVTQFIYIENQYFRWPPLAEAIKQAVAKQIAKGRDPEVHGNVHLFVITNATDDGMGAGTVNTQRMLESLGRADTIPAITKLRRIEKIRKNAPAPPQVSRQIDAGRQERDQWKVELDRQIKEVEETNVKMEEIPGLKVHVCSLVAPDTREGYSWMPVYIHSKLMIVDDVFTTHGSANINTRSMMVDSELNIAHEWAEVTEALRRRLWNMHTSGIGVEGDPEEAFKAWEEIITNNKKHQMDRQSPIAPLIGFIYDNPTLKDLD